MRLIDPGHDPRAREADVPTPQTLEAICAAIVEDGYAVESDFVPAGTVRELAADARRRDAAGAFRAAGVGRADAWRRIEAIRGDRIDWLDASDASPSTQPWWDALERLRSALNRALYLGLFSFEGHYAIYPPGARYERHRDSFRNDSERVFSCVLYLNEAWSARDGGALRIHADAGARDILPIGGTLACFLSHELEHEVLPATRERFALTGWFRRRAL